MKLFFGLCFLLVGVTFHIESRTINSTVSQDASVQNDTKSLLILNGNITKVHLKPTLRSITVLRAGTSEIVIDPVDNFQLKRFDVRKGQLRSIPSNTRRLSNLVVLNLCGNRIEQIDLSNLNGLDRLRRLNLGHNRISTVAITDEVNLPSLEELFLHGNRIETLDLSNLKADRLRRLYLSQNKLVTIGGFPYRYPQLQRVDLYQNEWDCEWLQMTLSTLRGSGVETLSYLPERVCDERGSVRVSGIGCQNITPASSRAIIVP